MRTTVLFIGLWTAGMVQAGSILQDRTGISLRSSFWSVKAEDTMVRVSTHGIDRSEVEFGGIGAWVTFLSGIGQRGGIEFSLGGVGRVEANEKRLFTNDVQISGVMPVLLGYQYPILHERNTSAFQPYVSAGGGPYILSDVRVLGDALTDAAVTVKNRVRAGVYGAVGGYFLFTNWFAFHGEVRGHLVNFNPDDLYSGFELGLGLAFFWKR